MSIGAPAKARISRTIPALLSDQVVAVLRERIITGDWPMDYQLPAEPDLATELGVARGTLRVAIRHLEREGILKRLRGRGTFVGGGSGDLPIVERFATISEVLTGLRLPYRVDVLEQTVGRGPSQVRRLLGLEGDEELFLLRRRFVVEGSPYALVANRVPVTACPRLRDTDFTNHTLFGTMTACGIHISWGRRTFSAVADAEAADLLAVDPSAPLLHIEQLTYDATSRPVEHSDVWAAGARLRLTSVLER
ncbi:MAG: GntR family transcriptional regulator [Chloroflexi bacterium]|nr:GntR family transcriptional regulator [Chloroflexota bacterium]